MPAPVLPPASVEETDCRISLLEALDRIHDPRSPHGRIYPLGSILALVLVAVLSGCRNPTQIYVFAKANPGLLRQLGFHPPRRPALREDRGRIRAPNEDTIIFILGRVGCEQVAKALASWILAMVSGCDVGAVDGKTLRGTGDHVLSLFVNRVACVVWQKGVGDRENELSALTGALSALFDEFPGIRLLTGDAMFCQKEIARLAVEKKRHYLLQLKAPHATDVGLAEDALRQLATTAALAKSEEKRGARKVPSSSPTNCGAI